MLMSILEKSTQRNLKAPVFLPMPMPVDDTLVLSKSQTQTAASASEELHLGLPPMYHIVDRDRSVQRPSRCLIIKQQNRLRFLVPGASSALPASSASDCSGQPAAAAVLRTALESANINTEEMSAFGLTLIL